MTTNIYLTIQVLQIESASGAAVSCAAQICSHTNLYSHGKFECKRCVEIENIEYVFVHCGGTRQLWKQLFRDLQQRSQVNIPVQAETIIFGHLDLQSKVSYIILIGKQHVLRQTLWGQGYLSIKQL